MPTMFDDVEAKCPFFKSSDKRKILCEGIIDDCATNLIFISEQKKKLHRKVFCDAKYGNCKIYKILEEKYEK